MKRMLLVLMFMLSIGLTISLAISDRDGSGIFPSTVQVFYKLPETMPYNDYIYLKSIGVNMPYVDVREDKVVFATCLAESDVPIPNYQSYGMEYNSQQAYHDIGMHGVFAVLGMICTCGIAIPITILWMQRKGKQISFKRYFGFS